MKTLRIILYTDSEINYKTDKETALTALEDWKEKLKACGIYDIEDFIKIKNALLLDEDSFIEDSLYNLYDDTENNPEPLWKNLPRYEDFIEIKPTPFNILFKDRDFETVQLHSIEPLNDLSDIIGFVGAISWLNNELKSLDGDSYYPEMLVYGYKETDEGLDILVKDW